MLPAPWARQFLIRRRTVAPMIKRTILGLAMVIAAALMPTPVSAAPTAVPFEAIGIGIDCNPSVYAFTWDLAAAAQLKVRHGKKRPLPLGMAGAQAVAGHLNPDVDLSPLCSGEGTQDLESMLSAVTEAIASGDTETALAQLRDLIAMLHYVSSESVARSAPIVGPRASGPSEECTGLSKRRDYRVPDEVTNALRTMRYLGEQAAATSDPALAEEFAQLSQRALEAAQAAATSNIEGGADNAQSAADWLPAAQMAQALGLDGAAAFAMGKARAAALTAFKIKLKSRCPSPREANCLGEAVAAYSMLGGDDATVASMTQQWGKASQDAKNPFKKKECRGELYEFRMIWDDQASGTSGDTGAVRFRILDEELTFMNFPMLNLKSGGVARCARINMEGELVNGDVVATGRYQGGQFPLVPVDSRDWSELSEDGIKLSLFFGQEALIHTEYGRLPAWPPCADSDATRETAYAANEQVFALIKGIELPRRKTFIRATGPVRIYFIHLCQRGSPDEPCDK